MSHYDIIIVGSGIVGSVAALALSKISSLKIALLESKNLSFDWEPGDYDYRVSAISLASQRILQNLEVWPSIQAKRFAPYTDMHVWDEVGRGKIHFNCHEVHEPTLGFIIEDSVMRTSLLEILSSSSIDLLSSVKLNSLQCMPDSVELKTEDGKNFSAKLLIAADGANSWVRDQVNIPLKHSDYGQTAIVANIQTTLSHQHTAWQRFLTTGPLAFLPLAEINKCSIVWSARHDVAEELLTYSDEVFMEKLTNASEKKLGEITHVSKRLHFPLRMRHAKNYVGERVVLIGDAAHTIHPLAGQGVNLGMLDAVTLAEVIGIAVNKKRDFFSLQTLRRYERWRKADNLMMLTMVDGLKQLFGQENGVVKDLRNVGLGLVDRFGVVKNILTRYALGNRSDLPLLATAALPTLALPSH